MLYHMYEATRMAIMPWRMGAQAVRNTVTAPWSPLSYTPLGKQIDSAAEMFERVTRRYGKPDWGFEKTVIDGKDVAVEEEVVIHRTYCSLVNFKRDTKRNDPKLLVVAPVSGHYATLLRGTVETMLPDHDVYVTDWTDCRYVPITADRFNLSDYIDYIIDFLHYLGPNTHVLAVCQPSVPALAAVSIMSGWGDICAPASMTLMGGPIDTRRNPTAVNKLAKEHTIEWFERHVVTVVPPPYPGMGRRVYPGFIQLTNFISMNLDKHMISLNELFDHLVQGDEEEADKKKAFYDEYLAVMDLPAEFYLETVETVFQKHSLPKGEMMARWNPVKPEQITKTAILCVEGELDDISGVGQTQAALDMTPNLPDSMKHYHLQKNVGHYGVFNGGRWRREIAPVVKGFIREHDHELGGKARKVHAIAS
ncbi:polyhydroxyalkanoate depolymerase [Nisaea denitrificans]|uniref:polyhydroxyalkanoate depolymerase n=1 Tax=Nisaea denitrificans TaxID=390877 RepID=UPI000401490F|nr:polyhydroxyalkanoate depolymerase [Nisaea denitrificans]